MLRDSASWPQDVSCNPRKQQKAGRKAKEVYEKREQPPGNAWEELPNARPISYPKEEQLREKWSALKKERKSD